VVTNNLTLVSSVPLVQDEGGAVRLAGSRVTLDSLVNAFHDGATPEQIQDSFPTLSLGAIYGAIAYYLDHREEVDAYLRERRDEAAETWERLETLHSTSLRDRLRARRRELTHSE
jgi:uncharacterized protein (DUF433 family)